MTTSNDSVFAGPTALPSPGNRGNFTFEEAMSPSVPESACRSDSEEIVDLSPVPAREPSE